MQELKMTALKRLIIAAAAGLFTLAGVLSEKREPPLISTDRPAREHACKAPVFCAGPAMGACLGYWALKNGEACE